MSEGALRDSTRVAEVVPEFAANDKQDVTVEHLLTHTAGFPRAPMRPEEGADREQRRKRLAERSARHAQSSHPAESIGTTAR